MIKLVTRLVVILCLLLALPLAGQTVVSTSGMGGGGFILCSTCAAAASWSSTATYTGVRIAAAISSSASGQTATVYLTKKIGPGTTAVDEIARRSVPLQTGGPSPAPTLLLDNLSLAPGTYYLTILSSGSAFNVNWRFGYYEQGVPPNTPGTGLVAAANVTIKNASYKAANVSGPGGYVEGVFDASYPPASTFLLTTAVANYPGDPEYGMIPSFSVTAGETVPSAAIQGVLNGASYSGNLAPGTWAAIFGSSLAPATAVAGSIPLPTSLNGVSVTFGGIPAPLVFVSPGQVNAIIPFEVGSPNPGRGSMLVPVVVKTPTQISPAFNVPISRNAPGIFTLNQGGTGGALAFDGFFKPVTAIGSAPIILYATGLGPTTPTGSSASGGASTEPFNRVQDSVKVFIGETEATVAFAGLAPGFPGIYQLNVIPNGPVTERLMVQVNGWQSNIASLPVPQGSNVTGVRGSIEGLWPPTGANLARTGYNRSEAPTIQTSAMLAAGSFETSFDIVPTAQPFAVVAVSDGGAGVIRIDPGRRTWTASVSSPAAGPRSGSFANTELSPLVDFASCTPTGQCMPFPGDTVPQNRIDPAFAAAVRFLGLPTTLAPGGVNALITSSGTIPANGHFDSTLLLGLADFGGFLQISHAGPSSRTATFRLYVDGKLIASKDAEFKLP